jgi:hypothetical protein
VIFVKNWRLAVTLRLIVRAAGADEERIDRITRELLKEIRADIDPRAELPTVPGIASSKGGAALIGQIAMSLISGGVIGKLVDALTGYLNQNRKIVFDLEKPDGTKLNLSYDYVRRKNADEITAALVAFLK